MSDLSDNASVACLVCGHSGRSEICSAPDHHYGIPGSFRLVGCVGCGLAQLDPMPSEEELAAFYPPDYAPHAPFQPLPAYRRLLNRILLSDVTPREPEFRRPGRMLDIGCGSGGSLYEWRAKGWAVQGVEPNPAAAEAARGLGVDVHCGSLETAAFPTGAFAYVRLFHVFEHVSRPLPLLAEIHRILEPGGKLFIAVPDYAGTTSRWFGTYWWCLGLPVHVYQYTHRTLPALLEQNGFQVEHVRHNSHFGGLFGSLQIFLNRKKAGGRSTGLLTEWKVARVIGNWGAAVIERFGTGDLLEVTAHSVPQGRRP